MILLAIQQQKRKKVAIQLMVKKNAKNKKSHLFSLLFPEKTNLKSDTTK